MRDNFDNAWQRAVFRLTFLQENVENPLCLSLEKKI